MRVNIESSALAEGRFNKLAQDFFEGSRAEAIGTLVLIWFDSQEREFVFGSKSEIISFLPYFEVSINERLFDALLKYSYIKQIGDDEFEIAGNDKHVQKLIDLRNYGSNGGKRSAEVRKAKYGTAQPINPEANPNQDRSHIEAVQNLQARSLERNSIQYSAIQFNTNQSNSKKEKSASALPTLALLWNELKSEKLPKVEGCGKTRRSHAEQRWSEYPMEEYWSGIIDKINLSPFCTGTNDRGWKADFDFFIRPETHLRVLEGKYDDQKAVEAKRERDAWLRSHGEAVP